jgi:hypothetical protein
MVILFHGVLWYNYGVFLKVKNLIKKSPVFWDMTLCSPLKVNWRFGGTYRFHLSLFDPEKGGDMFPLKRRLTFNGLHSVILQKIVLFITSTVRISNPTYLIMSDLWFSQHWRWVIRSYLYNCSLVDVDFYWTTQKFILFLHNYITMVWIMITKCTQNCPIPQLIKSSVFPTYFPPQLLLLCHVLPGEHCGCITE